MAYQALYREWRPKDFSHVVGQKAIMETLRNQVINRRIAHAYLFCGSRGTGKTSTAKILAKAINCLSPVNGDPCGVCENCMRTDREETLDVIEIDAASNNGVDEMRDLRDTVKYPPQYGSYKVYIIDEVHMLSTSAFNALLKTLEEPPAHIVFILATTEPQKLPETILSRCQRFDFGRISIQDITGRLKEAADGCSAEVSDGALMLIARAAEGGMRDALSLLDMCLGYSNKVDENLVRSILGTSDTSFLFRFCDALAMQDAGCVFMMIDQLMKEGKDPAVFAKDICGHIRGLLIAKTSPDDLAAILNITEEEAKEYIQHSENMTFTRLIRILDLYMSLGTEMRYTSSPRMALENISIKCCLKTTETDEQALSDRITELENRIAELTRKLENGSVSVRVAAAEPGRNETEKTPTEKKQAASSVKPTKNAQPEDPAVWKQFMTVIRQKDMAAWSFLSQGSLVSSRDGHFRWQANRKEGEQQFIAVLNNPDRKKVICDCLADITGQQCMFSAIEKDSAVLNDNSDDAYLETLYDTFGKGPVNVVDQIK